MSRVVMSFAGARNKAGLGGTQCGMSLMGTDDGSELPENSPRYVVLSYELVSSTMKTPCQCAPQLTMAETSGWPSFQPIDTYQLVIVPSIRSREMPD